MDSKTIKHSDGMISVDFDQIHVTRSELESLRQLRDSQNKSERFPNSTEDKSKGFEYPSQKIDI